MEEGGDEEYGKRICSGKGGMLSVWLGMELKDVRIGMPIHGQGSLEFVSSSSCKLRWFAPWTTFLTTINGPSFSDLSVVTFTGLGDLLGKGLFLLALSFPQPGLLQGARPRYLEEPGTRPRTAPRTTSKPN